MGSFNKLKSTLLSRNPLSGLSFGPTFAEVLCKSGLSVNIMRARPQRRSWLLHKIGKTAPFCSVKPLSFRVWAARRKSPFSKPAFELFEGQSSGTSTSQKAAKEANQACGYLVSLTITLGPYLLEVTRTLTADKKRLSKHLCCYCHEDYVTTNISRRQ